MNENNRMDTWKKYLSTEHFIIIDIGTYGAKVMEIKRRFKEYSIEKMFYLPEMNKFFKSKDIINMNGIVENILNMLKVEEIKAKTVILSFTSNKMQSKVIKLPDIADKDMKSFIEIEYQKQFPNSSRLSDILDYMPVGKLKIQDQIGAMILVASFPIRESTNIVQEIESKRLNLKKIDVDVNALGKTGIEFDSENVDRVVFDIGHETSHLVFIRDSTIVFSRPILYGTSNLAKALQVEEDITLKDAERIIEETGVKTTEDVLVRGYKSISRETYNHLVDENLGSALNEAYRTFQFVNSNIGIDVDEIILTGGFSCLPGAIEVTKSSLDMNVVIWSFDKEEIQHLANGCRIKNNTGKVINGTFATCFGMLLSAAQ